MRQTLDDRHMASSALSATTLPLLWAVVVFVVVVFMVAKANNAKETLALSWKVVWRVANTRERARRRGDKERNMKSDIP